MNYKNLVFTVLMAVSFMNHGGESSNSSNGSSINWYLKGLAAVSTLKFMYHARQCINAGLENDCNWKDYYQNIFNHNQKVVSAGRTNMTNDQVAKQIDSAKILPTDLAKLTAEYAGEGETWANIRQGFANDAQNLLISKTKQQRNKPNLIMGVEVGRYENPLPSDVNGSFVLLNDNQKRNLFLDKQQVKIQQKRLSQMINGNLDKGVYHAEQGYATARFCVFPSLLALGIVKTVSSIKSLF